MATRRSDLELLNSPLFFSSHSLLLFASSSRTLPQERSLKIPSFQKPAPKARCWYHRALTPDFIWCSVIQSRGLFFSHSLSLSLFALIFVQGFLCVLICPESLLRLVFAEFGHHRLPAGSNWRRFSPPTALNCPRSSTEKHSLFSPFPSNQYWGVLK